MQYVGKSETKFNIRHNNHRKDVTKKESIPASNHFEIERHNFNTHAKFILIEQLDQTHLCKLTLWKKKFLWKTKISPLEQEKLHRKGLTRVLNKIQFYVTQVCVHLHRGTFNCMVLGIQTPQQEHSKGQERNVYSNKRRQILVI